MTTSLLLALLLSQASQPCLEQYLRLHPEDCPGSECLMPETAACDSLANALSVDGDFPGRLAESALTSDMVEPTLGTVATTSQVDAAVSVKTVGMFGTSLGVSSAHPEEGALLTVAVNPLAMSETTPGELARRSRLTDLRLVMPAALLKGTPPDFIGLSANLDFIAATRAGREFETLLQTASETHEQVLVSGGRLNAAIRTALNHTLKNDPEQRARCLGALFAQRTSLAAIDAECKTTLSTSLEAGFQADRRFREALSRFRREAEQSHGGLNLRLSIPTSQASTRPLQVALQGAYSLQLAGSGSGWQARLSASAGGDYQRDQTGSSAAGGLLAVSLSAEGQVMELGALRLGAGLRGHLGQSLRVDDPAALMRTGNYLHGELGVHVPIGETGIALMGGMTWPLWGEGAGNPIFTTTIDYAFLRSASR